MKFTVYCSLFSKLRCELLPQSEKILSHHLSEPVSDWFSLVIHPALRTLSDLEPAAGADQVLLLTPVYGGLLHHLQTHGTLQGPLLLRDGSHQMTHDLLLSALPPELKLELFSFPSKRGFSLSPADVWLGIPLGHRLGPSLSPADLLGWRNLIIT